MLVSAHQQQQQSSLLAAMQHIVPSSQAAAVLPLLVKLMHLETHNGSEPGASAVAATPPVTDSWDAAAL
jgi:hypothetical protein